MDPIIQKAMRLKKPKYVNVQLRPELYDFLNSIAIKLNTSVPVVVRGMLEQVYDNSVGASEGGDPVVL